SFNLLRRKVRGKHAAPFVDDIIVRPEFLPEFLPRLYAILDRYQLLYTIAGHVGNGNFHIIPLMDLRQKSEREKIPRVSKEVYKLVLHYGGSLSAEHNDGLIRGPYLQQMYGRKVFDMFVRVKKIFDPQGIFNPRKKTGASLRYAMAHIRKDEP
ncbi:FAD-binding oxidoreductase, partial [Candidatus Parcubacteria bacterium]